MYISLWVLIPVGLFLALMAAMYARKASCIEFCYWDLVRTVSEACRRNDTSKEVATAIGNQVWVHGNLLDGVGVRMARETIKTYLPKPTQ